LLDFQDRCVIAEEPFEDSSKIALVSVSINFTASLQVHVPVVLLEFAFFLEGLGFVNHSPSIGQHDNVMKSAFAAELLKHLQVLVRASSDTVLSDIVKVDNTADFKAAPIERSEVLGNFGQDLGVGSMGVVEAGSVQDHDRSSGNLTVDSFDVLSARLQAGAYFHILTGNLLNHVAFPRTCNSHDKDDLGGGGVRHGVGLAFGLCGLGWRRMEESEEKRWDKDGKMGAGDAS